jgi:hypothetical protein
MMKAVGILTTTVTTVVVVFAAVVAVRSLPDIRRYLRKRSM